MDDIWSQYDALSHRSYLRVGVNGLERTLAESSPSAVRSGHRELSKHGADRPRAPVADRASEACSMRSCLRRANTTLKASLRYCEGHLHRIDGEADKLRHRSATANQHFTEAVSAFREAAELRRDWPDPFLGLARVFIYGLEDVDRACGCAEAGREAWLHDR